MSCKKWCSDSQTKWILVGSGSVGLVLTIAMVLGLALHRGTQPGCHQESVCRPDADMLDYMLSMGHISHRDGLLVTWYHAANSKKEMEAALSSLRKPEVNLKTSTINSSCGYLSNFLERHMQNNHAGLSCQ